MATFPDVNAIVACFPAKPARIEKDSLASVASVLMSLWRATGPTPVGDKPNALGGANCSRLTLGAGQLLPVTGGKRNHALSLTAFAAQPGTISIVDRVWHSDSLSLNNAGAQTINSGAFPARVGGGSGLELGFEIWSPPGAAAISPSVSYTDATGGNGAGRTATMAAAAVPASAIAGRFFPFNLQSGDAGISAIASCTTGASGTAGEGGLVVYRTLFDVVIPASTSTDYKGLEGTGLFEIPDDACLALLDLTVATTSGKVRVTYPTIQAVPA